MCIRDRAIGLNLTKYKLMAFVTSAALAGAAGALYGLNYSCLLYTSLIVEDLGIQRRLVAVRCQRGGHRLDRRMIDIQLEDALGLDGLGHLEDVYKRQVRKEQVSAFLGLLTVACRSRN